ncbi:hypothetical protein EK21DRAFT_106696 [Setomelanomma holmii]|uniref:Anaphase-promoting complex subunit CDC26 n=1 Tax=Setomelanomma holmii TaxID=210430 RepID=A0A9P4HLQ4_9PLEO|nr:hypothetical protein EK21DRAFT_106696 [Setomelanomma holmii]
MLRRPATTIQLTQADVEQYEADRQRRLWEQQQAQKQLSSQSTDASGKLKEQVQPTPMKSKKDRIMERTRKPFVGAIPRASLQYPCFPSTL